MRGLPKALSREEMQKSWAHRHGISEIIATALCSASCVQRWWSRDRDSCTSRLHSIRDSPPTMFRICFETNVHISTTWIVHPTSISPNVYSTCCYFEFVQVACTFTPRTCSWPSFNFPFVFCCCLRQHSKESIFFGLLRRIRSHALKTLFMFNV